MRTIFLLVIIIQSFNIHTFAQFGEIRGTVSDQVTGITLPGATIIYSENGVKKGVVANADGEYRIKPLVPGSYDIQFSYVSYDSVFISSVVVSAEKATYLNGSLSPGGNLPIINITEYENPLIDKGNASSISVLGPEVLKHSIGRDVKSRVANTPGIFQRDDGRSLNVRGSRENSTLYVVDGIKMTGDFNIPNGAIHEITVITGGIPAQFGDATGGVILITTKNYRSR